MRRAADPRDKPEEDVEPTHFVVFRYRVYRPIRFMVYRSVSAVEPTSTRGENTYSNMRRVPVRISALMHGLDTTGGGSDPACRIVSGIDQSSAYRPEQRWKAGRCFWSEASRKAVNTRVISG
jgi:hypothetical protein